MSHSEPAISAPLELQLVSVEGACVTVEAAFAYDPGDPFAVRAEFSVGPDNEPVVWVFARDLVVQGLQAPAGEGDVSVWPSRSQGRAVVCLALSSPDGQALLECQRDDVVAFLDRTLATVPAGDEARHLDVDSQLDRLLDEA